MIWKKSKLYQIRPSLNLKVQLKVMGYGNDVVGDAIQDIQMKYISYQSNTVIWVIFLTSF